MCCVCVYICTYVCMHACVCVCAYSCISTIRVKERCYMSCMVCGTQYMLGGCVV